MSKQTDKLVRLTRPMQWTVGTWDLEYGDLAVVPEKVFERYRDDLEEVDRSELAARLVDDEHSYAQRREFLSLIGELPDSRDDASLKEALEAMCD